MLPEAADDRLLLAHPVFISFSRAFYLQLAVTAYTNEEDPMCSLTTDWISYSYPVRAAQYSYTVCIFEKA